VSKRTPVLLVVKHVPWEGPHRILDACGAVEARTVEPLRGDPLPDHAEVAGALVMGGPMNVDEVERYPALAAEREWLAEAVRRGMPVLGICLGAQLLARALGARVTPGDRPEIGFAEVEVGDAADPIVGPLAPTTTVLHWHGDVFELPDGATPLASSAQTAQQAFRFGNAWGLLFHPEADAALVDAWLGEPSMAEEARRALGPDGAAGLPRRAREVEPELVRRSTPAFRAFAGLVEEAGGG
jgi:GMP synthase (glutamine-hydrolysing)